MEAVHDVGQFLVGSWETTEAQLPQAVEQAPQERGELCIGEAMWVGSGCAFEA
ncbi:hypothetical protein [Dictyobacter aurantiacus]|uniref:Uncharacterized protein n=1 Tax=Dictyobacter aurantiacus TaxID=1936993 RepID=A0A401ZTE1_9CHLR|nr:hypothetical protein [Dictyobacter aurantiacus]GCE10072.1 hypothetical protein KDAU_74010 [Dictyobacter aurantiacus]